MELGPVWVNIGDTDWCPLLWWVINTINVINNFPFCNMYFAESTGCTEGQVRLAGGSMTNEGRVELCSGGMWIAIYFYTGWRQLEYRYKCR